MTSVEGVALNDQSYFVFIPGLWTGDRSPLTQAAVLRSTNFRGDGFLDYNDIAELEVRADQLAARKLEPGDIIIERSGGGPKQPVGRVAIFDPSDDRSYATSNFTAALRIVDRSTFDPHFVIFSLHSLYLSGSTERLQRATTGIRNLDWAEYQAFKVPKLPLDEQRSIAQLLSRSYRGAIVNNQQLEILADPKRAAMRTLFTKSLRGETLKDAEIGPMPESWQPRTVLELCDIQSGGTPRKSVAEYWIGDIPWASGKDLKVPTLHDTIDHVSQAGVDAGSRIAPADAVLILVRGMGLAKDLPVAVISRPMAFNQDLKALVSRGEFSGTYIRSAIYSAKERLLSRIVPSAHGTMTLNLDDIENLKVPCPTDPVEANEIVEILLALDRKIDLHKRKRAVLEELFRSLLHKLMTGEIRVADLDLSALETDQPDGAPA